MLNDHAACYAALLTHDRRFDGRLFVGVTSTGIYCRPVCTARTPKAAHCRFFAHAASAEAAGFRPCLRCRPELAPTAQNAVAAVDAGSRLALAAAQCIDAGDLEFCALKDIAVRLGVGERHLRRVFAAQFGLSPLRYAQTQRLLLAKRLLADTALPLADVALAAGFHSQRRFEATLRAHYALTPGALRRRLAGISGTGGAAGAARPEGERESLQVLLAYRPPFDWPALLRFFAARCIAGVETVGATSWQRTLCLPGAHGPLSGWVRVRHAPKQQAVQVELSLALLPVLAAVLAGVRRVFDLACEPHTVSAALGPLAERAPGLRVPGAFDGFEMAVRAILGQQVSVKAAHTLAGRFASAFGTPLSTPVPGLERLFPTAATVAALSVAQIAALGIVRQRANAIRALAAAVAQGQLLLAPSAPLAPTLARLRALPGIGEWTTQYIALRALGWPDAWPSGDVVLMKTLGVGTRREADALAAQWRPWRGYATLHLWARAGQPASPQPLSEEIRHDSLDAP